MTLWRSIKQGNNNSSLAPFIDAQSERGAGIPAASWSKVLLFGPIVTIYQIFPPARKGYPHVDR
jgi:hypothetical protein